jgi:hypothetical protein
MTAFPARLFIRPLLPLLLRSSFSDHHHQRGICTSILLKKMPSSEAPPSTAKHNGLEFVYNCGLAYHDELFDAQVVSYLPQSPVHTKSSVPDVDQPPQPRAKSAEWWKAQCAFRGLDPTGTMADLQDRLRAAVTLEMLPALQDLQ